MGRPALFFSSLDPVHRTGGVEVVLSGLVRRFAASGRPFVEVRTEPKPGADRCRLYVPNDPRFRLHLPSLLRAARTLLRYRPAVVNVHFVNNVALYFVVLKRMFGYRLVLSAHGSDIRVPDPKTRRHLREILRGADLITVVSSELRQRVLDTSDVDPRRVVIVRNGIDHAFWTPGSNRRAEGMEIIAAARLEDVKGIDLLIEAFARVLRRLPQARVTIAGDGSKRRDLEDQARSLDLAGHVEFTGPLAPEALRGRYRSANLFVLPSRSEGFPIALLEAMATGLPYVAADVGGVGEIVTEAAGLLVPPEDPGALATGICRILSGDACAAGRAARRRAADFPLARAEDTYLDLLDPIETEPPDRADVVGT